MNWIIRPKVPTSWGDDLERHFMIWTATHSEEYGDGGRNWEITRRFLTRRRARAWVETLHRDVIRRIYEQRRQEQPNG